MCRYSLLGLVIARARHVGQVCGERLYLAHELVAHQRVVGVHVVREVPDVQDHVEVLALHFIL